MNTRQARGKKHKKYIKKQAMRIWKDAHYQKGLWDDCLKTALENHRQRIQFEETSKALTEKLLRETKETSKAVDEKLLREQLALQCDNNGWVG